MSLSEQDRELLAFERDWWRHGDAKDVAVRELLGLTPTDYYRSLSRIIEADDALVHDALLVRRLRRQRAVRQQERSARREDRTR